MSAPASEGDEGGLEGGGGSRQGVAEREGRGQWKGAVKRGRAGEGDRGVTY
jgi:hypothetical protein